MLTSGTCSHDRPDDCFDLPPLRPTRRRIWTKARPLSPAHRFLNLLLPPATAACSTSNSFSHFLTCVSMSISLQADAITPTSILARDEPRNTHTAPKDQKKKTDGVPDTGSNDHKRHLSPAVKKVRTVLASHTVSPQPHSINQKYRKTYSAIATATPLL